MFRVGGCSSFFYGRFRFFSFLWGGRRLEVFSFREGGGVLNGNRVGIVDK